MNMNKAVIHLKNGTRSVSKMIEWEKMRKCVFLSVAYSANMGGTGSMIGANANLILMGLIKEYTKYILLCVY